MSAVEPGADPGTEPTSEPTAEPSRGMRAVLSEDFSFADAVGGVRGLAESVAPGLVFVVVYLVTYELVPALVAALAAALLAVVVRLVQRTPITQAASGIVGVAIGVVWAWRTGEPSDYFVYGLWTNGVYLLACLVSILVGWPLVGVVVGLLKGLGTSWRKDPAAARDRQRFRWATWLWVAMFGARLAVQVPAYLAEDVAWLGTARLAMGVPLWALTLWLTWLLVHDSGAGAERPDPPARP
ncbi:MAG: DUF3159 domain-containing protein [Actinomycetota bacterium]|nr:DUF3159 domain-containing protein [Actinomycetota bacterium]